MGENAEARFARKLASNDGKTRNRALKSLKKWMSARSAVEDAFTELEMMKLWKGLHMCMWHSDKPLVQEELAENIASFVHILQSRGTALLFLRCFFSTMSREWLSIDRLRLDKFYTLIRKVVRHALQCLRDSEWDSSFVQSVCQLLSDGPLHPNPTCSGVQLHVVEVYLPELLAVGARSIPSECSLSLLKPFCHLLANTRDSVTTQTLHKGLFSQLVVGKKAQKLQLDLSVLSDLLLQLAVSRDTVGKNRKLLYSLRKRLQEFAQEQQAAESEIRGREEEEEGERLSEGGSGEEEEGRGGEVVGKEEDEEEEEEAEEEEELCPSPPKQIRIKGSSQKQKYGHHGNQVKKPRPKKRVSFSLHKNTISS